MRDGQKILPILFGDRGAQPDSCNVVEAGACKKINEISRD
jgi:hypothetical protein